MKGYTRPGTSRNILRSPLTEEHLPQLHIGRVIDPPALFTLMISLPGSTFRRECKLSWRSASDIGIMFTQAPAQNLSNQ
jgi:hypothetical protein